jgi:hypothetical protein
MCRVLNRPSWPSDEGTRNPGERKELMRALPGRLYSGPTSGHWRLGRKVYKGHEFTSGLFGYAPLPDLRLMPPQGPLDTRQRPFAVGDCLAGTPADSRKAGVWNQPKSRFHDLGHAGSIGAEHDE